MAAETTDKPFASSGKGTLLRRCRLLGDALGVYLMVGGLMFYSGKEKLFDDDGNAPQGIKDQFKGTFLDTFPGTDAAWVILGLLEFGVFLLLLASSDLPRVPAAPRQVFLQLGLAVALLTFACLAFGQTATNQFSGTASLYTYFGSTVVILILVSLMPPNRSDRWLGGLGGSRGS